MSGSNPLPAGQVVIIPQLGSGTLAAGNIGLNGGFGGQAASNSRPLSQPPQYQVRQPYLGGTPRISAIAGFGGGSGGGILNDGSDADQSQGLVVIKVGLNPSLTQTSIGLMFPFTPVANQYFLAADWAVVGENIVSTTIIITCNLTRRLIPGERLLLSYRWTRSV